MDHNIIYMAILCCEYSLSQMVWLLENKTLNKKKGHTLYKVVLTTINY